VNSLANRPLVGLLDSRLLVAISKSNAGSVHAPVYLLTIQFEHSAENGSGGTEIFKLLRSSHGIEGFKQGQHG